MMKRLLYLITMLLLFYSCDQDNKVPDEIQKKLIEINFNTSDIADIGISDMNIFLFDMEGKYIDSQYFPEVGDLQEIDYSELSFANGKQTIITIFNTGDNFVDNHLSQLTKADLSACSVEDFTNAINELFTRGTLPDMLTGCAQINIVEDTVYVTINVWQGSISFGVTQLTLNMHYPDSEYLPYTSPDVRSKAGDELQLRVLAEICNVELQHTMRFATFIGEPNNDGDYQFKIPLLKDALYEIRLWSDYTTEPYTDKYYNTTDTRSIKVQEKGQYEGNSMKDAFVSYHESFIIKSDEAQTLNIDFYRPAALYQIVATDVEKYNAEREKNGNPPLEDLIVEVQYQGYFPTGYDMTKPDLNDTDTGYKYYGEVGAADGSTVQLASDYVLTAGEGSHVMVNIIINEVTGRKISEVKNVKIEYKADCLTTISGDILTAGVRGDGVAIDTEWKGDHYVEF